MADVYAFLDAHGIRYERTDHPAVFTVEELKRLVPPLPATRTSSMAEPRSRRGREQATGCVNETSLE